MIENSSLCGFSGVMEPVPRKFNQIEPQDYWYEVKWDGVRLLTIIDRGRVTILNRHGRDKSLQFPELQQLPRHLQCKSAVVDGEGVVILDKHPDFPAIIRRNNRQGSPSDQLKNELPFTLMLFDLLSIDGHNLMTTGYEARKARLFQVLTPGLQFQAVESLANGEDLWAAVKMLNLEGMIAKKKGSLYHVGKRHLDWFKIKNRRLEWFVIGGYILKDQKLSSLLLGIATEGELKYCGRVGLSGKYVRSASLLPTLEANISADTPFTNQGQFSGDSYYVIPRLGALVEFAEWTPGLNLRQPVLKEIKPLGTS